MTKSDCQSVHTTIDVSSMVKNFESLLKFKDDVKKMREEGQTKLAMAIEKRKEIQVYLTQVSQLLKMALSEVNQQEEINSVRLVEMTSLLEGSNPHLKTAEDQWNSFLTELLSIMTDISNPDDSVDTLGEKMANSFQSIERQLTVATEMVAELENLKRSQLSVLVGDSKNQMTPTLELLENGFNTYWSRETSSLSPIKRDFLLLSHIIYSIKKRGSYDHEKGWALLDEPSEQLKPARSLAKLGSTQQVETSQKKPRITSNLPVEKFDCNKSILAITVRRWGAMKGTLNIKLSPSVCDSPFIRQLGEICFRSPLEFSNMMGKVIPISSKLQCQLIYLNCIGYSWSIRPDTSFYKFAQISVRPPALATCPSSRYGPARHGSWSLFTSGRER